MFLGIIVIASSILTIDVGQSYKILSRMDCSVGDVAIDMNGADSTSTMQSGKKSIIFLFMKKWPANPSDDVGVLAFETQGGETNLIELKYGSDFVPTLSKEPQPTISLQQGDGKYFILSQRVGPKNDVWNYTESQALVHGAISHYKGRCTIKGPTAAL